MTNLSTLLDELTSTINSVNRARNDVGSLPRDPDINDRVRQAFDHVVRAESLLEAVRDDVIVWMKEE